MEISEIVLIIGEDNDVKIQELKFTFIRQF